MNLSDDGHQLWTLWEQQQPEGFSKWQGSNIQYVRIPREASQVRLDLADARALDREASRSDIDRSQLIRAWVKERLRKVAKAR